MPEDRERMLRRKKAYNATEAEKSKRVARNRARRAAIKSGKAKVGDGTEVDHIRPLSKGGSTAASNTRLIKKATNRAHGLAKRPKGGSRYL
jgi:ribosomal protein S17